MKPLIGFLIKEFRHILRDRRTLAILLLLPLGQVLLFGFAVRTDIREIRLVVVDPSPDAASLSLANRFSASPDFTVQYVRRVSELEALFQSDQADQAIIFPDHFADLLGGDAPVELQLITDVADPNTGSTMQAWSSAMIQRWELERFQSRGAGVIAGAGAGVRIEPRIRMRFNPTLESVNLFVPGLIAVVLTVVSALMSAISLSREKETGTLEVLLVSPLRPWQIIVGKVAPYMVLGFVNVVTVLLAAWLVFGVPFEGSVVLLLFESLLFIVASLGLGVLVAAVTSSQRAAMIGALMGLMLPTLLLSGMIFPLASMPLPLQIISNIVPGKWFLLISRGIMLKGIGLTYLWQETLILVGMTVVVLVAASRRFNVRLDS